MVKRLREILLKYYKEIGSYLFLYLAFIGIFYDFAYNAWIAVRPISLMIVIFRFIILFILYFIINHILIRRILKKNILYIFESTLFLTIFTLLTCYGELWNR